MLFELKTAFAQLIPRFPSMHLTVGQRFLEAGLPDAYTNALLKQARKVVRLLQQGQFIAQTRRGAVVADCAYEEDDNQ